MKKIVFLIFILAILGCKGKTESESERVYPVELSTYKYKISGIEDQVVADSLMMMIRSVEGIQRIDLNHNDSTVFVKAEAGVINEDRIKKEIVNRGATIIQSLN